MIPKVTTPKVHKTPKVANLTLKLSGVLELMTFNKNELLLYSALALKPMTISGIKNKTKLSDRTVRTHLDALMEKELVRRKPVEGDRLMYEYYAKEIGDFVRSMRTKLAGLEKKRITRRDAIIRGTKIR